MIITRTPFRMSFIGGGSDLREFYSRATGAVISTSINKYMYISCHPFFNRKAFLLKYSKTEEVRSVEDIRHDIFREVLKKFGFKGGLEVSSSADIPAGTGLGSSSAFTVSLIHNLHTIKSQNVTKDKLAEEACRIEIDVLKAPIGKQDQYASAFGGLNLIEFPKDGSVMVHPIAVSAEDKTRLQNNLLMFYTKTQRTASEILKKQKALMSKDEKFLLIKEMVPYAYKLKDALYQRKFDYLGEVLHKGWCLKKKIAKEISSERINHYYNKALKAGAIGGKLLGAGGGGFLLFYCPFKKHEKLRQELKGLFELKFTFDHEGSKIIYIGETGRGGKSGFFE